MRVLREVSPVVGSDMYCRVVVPLDGSELAEGILPHVAELISPPLLALTRGPRPEDGTRSDEASGDLAPGTGLEAMGHPGASPWGRDSERWVYLLSVVPPMKGIFPAFVDSWARELVDTRPSSATVQEKDSWAHVERELLEYLHTVAKPLEAVAAQVQVSVRFGRPADEILTFASEVDANLIAMSTHGRSGLTRWVFGSVADRVLRGARCAVLIVQASSIQRPAGYRRIVVPLDGSELAEQVLPYVRALVHPGHTHVFLVSVLTTGLGDRTVALLTSYPPGLRLATTALDHAEIQLRSYLRSVATTLREHGAVVHIAVRRGSPADEILTYAMEVEANLISMTTHGLSGMGQWVYGNVAGKVLQGAHSPVLLVRPTPEQGGEQL